MANQSTESILNTEYAKKLITQIQNYKGEGNFMELFTSMEDVHIFIAWAEEIYPADILDSLKFFFGVSEPIGEMIEVEGIGGIDKSIATFVETLNKNGFVTLASCSGLLKDHPTVTDKMSGYLSFAFDKEKSERIQAICHELDIPYSEGKTYFKPSYIVRIEGEGDEEIGAKWIALRNKLNL